MVIRYGSSWLIIALIMMMFEPWKITIAMMINNGQLIKVETEVQTMADHDYI